MPIFDKELIDNVSDRNYKPLTTDLGSPVTREINPNLGGFESYGSAGPSKTGLSLEDMSKLTNVQDSRSWDGPVQMIPKSELLSNKRYGMYERGIDLENVYGLQQGWMSQLANGIVKMGATAIGTFGQSFATIPDTVASLKSGTKALSGGPDGFEASTDNWLKNLEDAFPNYVTRKEKEHPYLAMIPGFAGSANFWGNSVIKNIGFTVGAIGGALVQDAAIGLATEGIGEIPLLGAQIGKAALWMNKIFTGTNDVERVLNLAKSLNKTEKQLLTIKDIGEAAAGIKVINGARYGINLYGASRTEAGVEARDGYRQVYDELINHYKLENLGATPEGADLKEIENYATNAMNTRFGINMAILTASNAIQFDNLFKSFTSASAGFKSSLTKQIEDSGKIGLVEGSLDVFEKKAAKGIPGRVWESIKPKIPNIFSEGIYEEGGQYAAERGTYDYYTRKYKDPKRKENVNNWDSLNEVMSSTVKGLSDQFNTTDGINNMIVGGLSAIVTGGLLGKVESIKGHGKEARLQQSINSLNQYGLTGILQNKYADTLSSSGIAKEMDEAVKSGDVYKYKNLKNDMFFNFVNSRVSTGMHDVTIEQLEMLKDLSKEDFEKTFGMDFSTSNKNTVSTYVDSLVEKANGIKKTVDALDGTFSNPFTNIVNPKTSDEAVETFNHHTFNSWKTDLARYANVSPEVKDRLSSIQENITKINPLLDNNVLGDLTNKESLKEYSKSYEEQANQLSDSINEYTSPEDKRKIKDQVKALRTLSEKINLNINSQTSDIKTFEDVLNFELNGRNATKDKVIPSESAAELFKYGVDVNKLNGLKQRASDIFDSLSSEAGYNKYVKQAEDMASEEAPEIKTEAEETVEPEVAAPVHDFTNRAGAKETPELNKEYQIPQAKLAKVSKISDDRWQVTAPNGDITFHTTESKAKDAADELNQDFADLSKVKVLALNPDGTVKVEDLAGNIQNIDPAKLTGYERIQSEEEKLAKDTEEIEKQQSNIDNNSGDVATVDVASQTFTKESFLKPLAELFTSSITASEGSDNPNWQKDPTQDAPHIQRSRTFLNNAKNFSNRPNLRSILVTPKQEAALGLEGLAQLSYGVTDEEANTEEFKKKIRDVNNGLVAQVFVEQVGKVLYFIDEKGNQISKVGEKADLSRVVFQTQPSTKIVDSNGKPKYDQADEAKALAYQAAYTKYRKELFEAPETSYPIFKFNISRGVPIEIVTKETDESGNEINVKEKNHVGGILIPEKKISSQQKLIIVTTTGSIEHQGKLLKFPNGVPILQYADTLQFLNNRNFTSEEAKVIYQLLNKLASETVAQSKGNEKIKFNRAISSYLENVLYWKKTTTPSGPNQMYISGTTLHLGSKKFALTEISENEKEIVDYLKNTFNSVNNRTLSKNANGKFYEYYLDDKGELAEQPRQWKNYQTYLLAASYPDGSARSANAAPLSTSVAKPSTLKPNSFQQKYSTLIGLEFPIQEVKPAVAETVVAPVTTVTKIGEYTLNNTTENTIKVSDKFGDVKFTGTMDAENNIVITPVANEQIKAIAKDREQVAKFDKWLLDNGFEPGKTSEEKVLKVASILISNKLIDIQANTPAVVEEVVAEAPVVTPAPVSDIEAKKADIERLEKERDEKLNKEFGSNLELVKSEQKAVISRNPDLVKLSSDPQVADARAQEVIDKYNNIVAEYKAKIDDLEGKPTGEPKDFSGFNGPSSSFRAVVPGEKGVMTDAELQMFKDWHAKNVPNIPFEVLNNLITINGTKKAWGVFENGVAKFVKGGLKGTEYHEIFHGIFQGFLNDSKQQELRDEFRQREGSFTDRMTGRDIEYSEATDSQIEDKLADEFTEFRLGKIKAKSLTERVVNFFRSILDFIKSFVNKPSAKDSLFDAIDSGKFKEAKLTDAKTSPLYRAAEGLTEPQTHEFVQDMTARAAGIIYSEADKAALFNPLKITSGEMFSRIEDMYKNEKNRDGVSKRETIGDVAWKELIVKTKESLRTLGVNFNEDDTININDEAQIDRLYTSEPFSIDAKKSSPFAIKFTLATLFEVMATNQESELSLVMPKPKLSSVGGYKLLNFSRAFATVLDKLCNTTKVTNVIDKLTDLASYDPNYVRLFSRIGGNLETKTVNFNEFKGDDWRLFIQMMQTFTKQKPEALIQYKSGNSVHTAPANLFTAIKSKQREWTENIKAMSQNNSSFIRYNSPTKTYKVDSEKIKETPTPKTPKAMIEFLDKIGVIFPIEVYSLLKSEGVGNQRSQFAEAVSALYSQLGKEGDIYSVTGKSLSVDSRFAKLSELYIKVTNPNQESTFPNVEGEKTNAYAENNTPSVFENEFNEAQTLTEILAARPELKDIFSTHSIVLKEGGEFINEDGKRIKEIKIKYIQGTSDSSKNKGTSTSKLTIGARFSQEINQNLNGDYYILIPADSSTEWMINLGNHVTFEDFAADRASSQVHDIFRGYLKDDVALALDYDNRKQIRNIGEKGRELRFFKDILSKETLAGINNLIATGATQTEIETYITTNSKDINESVDNHLQNKVDKTISILKNDREVISISEDEFSYPSLDDTFATAEGINKNSMSFKELENVIKFANTNYVINNIEMHKLIFGDPYTFAIKDKKGKVILDETKRVKSFLSPRRTTIDSPEYNTFLIQNHNTVAGVELTSDDYGYQDFKDHVNTITLKDVQVASALANVISAYEDIKEPDAMSWLMDGTYREIKLKNGQWDLNGNEEVWHQWQMAYTRQNIPGYTYTSEALRKHDEALVKTDAPKHTIEVLKPIVTGVKYGSNIIDNVLDKFSQMPIYYSMVKDTTLESLYIKMFKDNIGYAIFESGRKMGAEDLYDLYTPGGDFNNVPFKGIIPVSWKSYGIQVETTQEGEKSQTRGSQLTKIASIDLFENGEASPEALAEYKRNVDILNKMHINATKQLFKKLGIVDTGSGFALPNKEALSNALVAEMLKREMSDNAKDTVKLDENKQFRIPFEASPSYVQIRNIIYSMIDKAIISPKVSGSSHVQVAVTGFEKATEGRSLIMKNDEGVWEKISKEKYASLNASEKKGVMLADDTLKFYTKDAPYCEIMLPHWFKDKFSNKKKFPNDAAILKYLNTEEGAKILTGIGFRIPTQALSSVEVFRVKGFLPQYMGSTAVVPSQITTKAGSDFDIDKLNLYLKSVYVDKNGDVKLVKYFDSEEATKDFYGKVFEDKLEKQKVNKAELLEAVDILTYGLEDPKNLMNRYSDILDTVLADVEDPSDYSATIINKLKKLGDKDFQASLKEDFVNDMYKRSLENEYYDSLEKLITLPENFERLISPVDDAGLSKMADHMDVLKGYNENNIKNRILDRNYMTTLRHAFVVAKKWVGIAAVNITNHALSQKAKIYIDSNRIALASKADKKFLKDGSMILPHNTVSVNGKDEISLSGRTIKDGKQLISSRLSGYATAFVDVAKDPYIMKLIQSDLTVGVFMFLERVGAGKRAITFLNQPIISEYILMLNSLGTKNLYNTKNIEQIKMQFVTTEKNIESTGIDISEKNLDKNITSYYVNKEMTPSQNAEQQAILDEFLKYAKMADYNFKFTQATNYDTTKFRSGDTLSRKQMRTSKALESNIISSVDKILENSHIGEQERLLGEFAQATGEIFKLEQDKFRAIIDSVLEPYKANEYMSQDNYEKIANKIRSSFIDYVVQTDKGYNSYLAPLLIDVKSSVANQLAEAKVKYPNIQILNDLQVESSDRVGGAMTVKLNVNLKDAYDENLYTGMMAELRDNPDTRELYNNLVVISILQGSYQSAVSIKNIIPIEDYSAIVAPAIANLQADTNANAFAEVGSFQRTNFRDDDVMPVVQPKFFLASEAPAYVQTNQFGDHYADIFQYYSSMFPNIKQLNLKSTDRRILKLSEKYNSFDLKSDFVKIPRVVTDRQTGDSIDMLTGETVTAKDYAIRKQKGDKTLNDVFGYKRVRYEGSGEPLIDYDQYGEASHIYKLINLLGDGQYGVEHYSDPRMSIFNNGTMKIDNEIPDEDIIEFYGGEPTYLDFEEVQPLGGFEIQKPVQGVENIPNSGLTIEQSNQFIDLLQPQIINQAYIENKAKTANMMFSFGLRWAKNIPNATEKSEQAKNLGQPRPDRKQINSKEGMTYGYYLTDQNNKPLPSIKELQPVMDFIQSKLGIDMSNYDAVLGNIYDDDSFIHQHRDTTESTTAQNYPVIVMNLGANGHLEYDKDVKSTYASYKKSGQLDLTNGGIYAFGVDGKNRFTFHHRIGSGLESANLLKPIKLPNGQILRNYRITLTFRRAADLEPEMPTSPTIISQENVVPLQPMQQALKTGKVEFDKLPRKSTTPTMTYAGIGSRQTPLEVLKQMTEVAKELESKGYTLNTGVTFGGKKEGADKAFDDGTTKKNLFSPENQGARTKEQVIAKEIHPNPNALTAGALKLMARNTNQVFGNDLNTPVDFVLFYAKETKGIRPEGGTGQAVEMARLKGIPAINLANPNWRQELDRVLSAPTQLSTSVDEFNLADTLTPTEAVTFDTLEEFTNERRQEVLTNFAAKHKMTEEQAKNYINEALQKNKEEVINKLKDCY